MANLQSVLEALSRDPGTWESVKTELESARNPRVRFVEVARERGLQVDEVELDGLLARAAGELNEADLESVAGGFNPQPDPPGVVMNPGTQSVLIGLLLPAVQKVRGV
jgi:hypothetical protein